MTPGIKRLIDLTVASLVLILSRWGQTEFQVKLETRSDLAPRGRDPSTSR